MLSEFVVKWPSVQFHRSVMSNTLQSPEPQYARPPCPSSTPRVHPNPCPLVSGKSPFESGSVQLLSRVQLFCDPMNCSTPGLSVHHQLRSSLKLTSIELVIPSKHLLLCCPPLLLPSIFPSIKVFSNESALCIRWPKYWSFSFNISPPMNTQDWSPLRWIGGISLQSKGL